MTLKEYNKQIAELHRIFKGEPPEWLVKKVSDVYERTKDQDLSELGEKIF